MDLNSRSYRINYYNKVFKKDFTIKLTDFNEALTRARSIKSLIEIENVKLYEVKEIDFN